MTRARGAAIALAVAAICAPARAEERCLTPEEFNAWAAASGGAAVRGRLVFDFVAPSLVGDYRVDAVVADMADRRTMTARGTACSGFQLKSWGDCRLPDDSPCTCSGMPCDGVVKMEGFDECGPMPGEAPFDPWHSQPVFTEDGRTCHLEMFFDATAHGYDLTCSGISIAPGRGENVFGIEITYVSVLENVGGGNRFEGAVLVGAPTFCFDDGVVPTPTDAGGPGPADAGLDAGPIDPPRDGGTAGPDGGSPRADAGARAARDLSSGCECAATSSAPRSAPTATIVLALWVLAAAHMRAPRFCRRAAFRRRRAAINLDG